MNEEQIAYVVGELQKGISPDDLKQILLQSGYSDEQIASLLAEADARMNGEGTTIDSAPIADAVSTHPTSLIGYKQLFSQSFKETVANILLLLPLVIVSAVTILVPGAILFGLMTGGFSVVLSGGGSGSLPVFLVGFVLVYVAMLLAMMTAGYAYFHAIVHRNEKLGYFKSYTWALANLWTITLVMFLQQFVSLIAFIFLILPGVAISFYVVFGLYAVAKGEARGLNALLRSTDLVYGRWWSVFGRVLFIIFSILICIFIPAVIVATIFSGAGEFGGVVSGIVLVLAYLFFIAWVAHGTVILGESLAASRPITQFDPTNYKTAKVIYIVLGILGGLLFVFQMYGMVATFQQMQQTFNSPGPTLFTAPPDSSRLQNSQSDLTDVSTENLLNLTRIDAELYFDSNERSYLDVCEIIEERVENANFFLPGFSCADSENAYAAEVELTAGYYCIDSTGFADRTEAPILGGTECRP